MALDRLSAQDARILALESPTIAGHTCKTVIAEHPSGIDEGGAAPPPPGRAPGARAPAAGTGALLATAAGYRLRAAGEAARALGRDVRAPGRLRRPSPRVLLQALRREGDDSPLDVPIGSHRRVAFVLSSLADFKHIRTVAGDGTTVNDVVLAAMAGALRAWLGHRGVEAPHMRVKVPGSMHPGDEEPSAMGNRDSLFFAALPVAEPHPPKRSA